MKVLSYLFLTLCFVLFVSIKSSYNPGKENNKVIPKIEGIDFGNLQDSINKYPFGKEFKEKGKITLMVSG